MPSIHCANLSFAYMTATPVVENVSLDLGPGWYGVVGANGSGKTTLLHLLAGLLPPTNGQVEIVSDLSPVWCPQEASAPSEDVHGLASRWDGHAARLRDRLGLDPGDLWTWNALSPGQQTRWRVAAALAREPEILLLDEPTNHLDRAGRALLLDELGSFDGVGLIVSHDRTLLDELTSATLRIQDHRVERHAGPYSEARERWLLTEIQQREQHRRARARERLIRQELATARHARSGADRGAAAARRRATHKEHDAYSADRTGRAARAEAKHGRDATVARRALDRAKTAVDDHGLRRRKGGRVTLAGATTGRDTVAALQHTVLTAGDREILRGVDVHIGPEDRIHVRGANGAGKTTLLRALLAASPLPQEQVLFLPQEFTHGEVDKMLNQMRDQPPAQRGRILGIAANLGADPQRLLDTPRPSPGEARKLALAAALVGTATFVALDEPTNHLDLPAIERLEDALVSYAGALLLVTHDDRLAQACTDTVWDLTDGTVTCAGRPFEAEDPR